MNEPVLNLLLRIIDRILDLGVSLEHPSENELTRLFNGMSILSLLGTLSMTAFAIYVDYFPAYIYGTLVIASVYVGVLLANGFGKTKLAKHIVALGSPLWINLIHIYLGSNHSQEVATLSAMAITYVAFESKPKARNAYMIFQFISLIISLTYVNLYGPLYRVIDFTYDEIVVFMGSVGWAIILLYKFDKDKNDLLQNLKVKNEELQNTTEELERYTYIASHDLKSPLRTINSFIELIENDIHQGNYKKVGEKIKYVKSGAAQMNYLVEDILEVSKLKVLEDAIHEPVNLNEVFEKVKHNLQEDIKEKSAQIKCEELPSIMGVELEFILLFQNLIQNGIKYNEDEVPLVQISASRSDSNVNLYFQDNGIGIDSAYHDVIFQFFKRLHNSSQYQGTGLGLGLCKRIINNYKGKIHVASELNRGTKFTIELPLSVVAIQ